MASRKDSIARTSLKFSGLFESELLLELMLRYWNHPFADDPHYRAMLLEAAAEALHAAIGGAALIPDIRPENVNLVAAIWYAEATSLMTLEASDLQHVEVRKAWLDDIRRALPSCFCDPDRLM